jgi:hypothetical protein
MADIKLSQLNQATAYTLNDIVAIVDSGFLETKKINIRDLFRNTDNITEATNQNNAVVIACDAYNPNFQALRGSNTTTAVIASTESYATGGNNFAIIASNNSYGDPQGHSGIFASDSVEMGNAYNSAIVASYSGPRIAGGEEHFIAASVGGCEIQGGGNNAIIAAQGFVMGGNSFKNAGVAVEAGGWNGPRFSFAGGGYNLNTINSDNGNQKAALAYNGLTFDGQGSSKYHNAGMAVESGTISHNTTALIAASGRTTLYDYTLHTDNLYSYERIQSETNVSTTINNEQILTGGLGMVQYTDVSAGNLNLKINDVRNGEVYNWVIDNQTGGSISVNSVATNTGFAITDNSSNSLTTGPHIFTIVIVNNKIIIEGTH